MSQFQQVFLIERNTPKTELCSVLGTGAGMQRGKGCSQGERDQIPCTSSKSAVQCHRGCHFVVLQGTHLLCTHCH